MPLTGLEIYKLLPQTNCKDCSYPTCLAFAMKLAAKQAKLKDCPHVSEEAANKLAAASAPPIRLIELSGGDGKLEVGNETVLFRHEKTFYHKPGLFLRIKAVDGADKITPLVSEASAYQVDYVGITLELDGFAIDSEGADGSTFAAAVTAAQAATQKPLILLASDPAVARAGLEAADGKRPLLYAADADNATEMVALAKEHKVPLVAKAGTLESLTELTQTLVDAGVEDIVLDPEIEGFHAGLERLTAIRRLAIKSNFRPLGFPVITFPGQSADGDASLLAAQHIAKYAGFIVVESFDPAVLYPLMVLRENIYTDPQKPIQVQPGMYEINSPDDKAPVMVTTNFSITYFSVANEVESSGWPAWLLVADAEGMSVLTAWAAGNFDADRIAKAVKSFGTEDKVSHRKLIIPGQVAVLSGELEEELQGWEIMVGPREAVDISGYLKAMWS